MSIPSQSDVYGTGGKFAKKSTITYSEPNSAEYAELPTEENVVDDELSNFRKVRASSHLIKEF